MHTWSRIVTIATAVALIPMATALAVSTGTPGSALGRLDNGGAIHPAAERLALAPPLYTPTSESQFTPITPCRAIDTRPGRITAGATKHFHIRGISGFPAQGGRSGGCGVPNSATGVAVSVSSVNIAGTGYLRIWPYGQSDPGATIAHYQRGPITTTGGTLTMPEAGSGFDVTAKAFDAGAGLVVDVTGYYAPPLAALVHTLGFLQSATSRVTSVTRPSTGTYIVTFDRDVSHCSYQVTPYQWSTEVYHGASPNPGHPRQVVVVGRAENSTGSEPRNLAFFITVLC